MIEIVFFAFLIAIISFFLKSEKEDSSIDSWLIEVKEKISNSNELDVFLQEIKSQSESTRFMANCFLEAMYRGEPLLKCISEIQKNRIVFRKILTSKKNNYIGFIIKLLILCSLALLGRLFLFELLKIKLSIEQLTEDRILMCLSAIFFILGMYWGRAVYPKSWIWRKSLTNKGKIWFQSLLFNTKPKESPWEERWLNLENKEFSFGINLRKEKEQILESWVLLEEASERKQMELISNFLPAFELLFGIGISIILLIIPVLALVEHS